MKGRDMVGELGYQRRIQSTRPGELIEQRRLIEAPHYHNPIDRRTLGAKADPVIWGADHRSHLKIQGRRGAPVEGKLGFAGYPAPFNGRKVEIRKLYCALELVGTVAHKKNQRHMRFDDSYALYRRSI